VAEVSASLLSHHLKVLRDAGSIAGARRGRWIDCTLDRAALVRLADALEPPTESVP
jgi:ArsR family transcriptional regulator